MILDFPVPAAAAESPFDWPDFGLQDDVRVALGRALAAERPSVMVTLYEVAGGAPRGVGSQMLFCDGDMAGYLSGGCVEADVALHAQGVMDDGAPRWIVYGEGGPPDIRLACGSRLNLFLERIGPQDAAAARLLALAAARKPALWLSDGRHRACAEAGDPRRLPPGLARGAHAAGAAEDLACGHVSDPFVLYRAYAPPLRLIVLGGDPIALAVVRLAKQMGVEVTLLRPKGPQASPFREVRYLRGPVVEAFAQARPDPWTAIAILTHDTELEHEALKAALSSDAGYVGALGSRRRIPQRNLSLQAAGFSDEAIARVRAPIGLPIGGKSPWAIAVSIVAEIVAQTECAGPV